MVEDRGVKTRKAVLWDRGFQAEDLSPAEERNYRLWLMYMKEVGVGQK